MSNYYEDPNMYVDPNILQNFGSPLYTPQEDRTDLLIFTFHSGEIISQFRTLLSGKIIDSEGKVKQVRNPICNDMGINGIMLHVEIAISKLTNLSDINEEEVYRITRDFAHNLYDDMWINKYEWGFKNVNLLFLNKRLSDTLFLTLKRAQDGGDRGLIKGVHKSIATTNIGQKGGPLGIANNILKGMIK